MIKIRRLKKGDLEEFIRAELSYYGELKANPRFGMGSYGKKVDRKSLKKQFSIILKNIRDGRQIVLVAEDGGRIVAMCEGTGGAWVEGPHIVDIGTSVVKGYRNKGIGSTIFGRMLQLCRKKYEIAIGGYFANNAASKALVKRYGFKRFAYGPRFAKRGKVYMDTEMVYLKLR